MHTKIAVIGLGYVGLPLARLFATKYPVVGFDINTARVAELRKGQDSTLEVEESLLRSVILADHADIAKGKNGLYCTCDAKEMSDSGCDFFVVTVPTPVDRFNHPDLTPLHKASETVGRAIRKGNVVVFESTVYPGATEEECIPVIEKTSGLKFNVDFFAGYSPERINPGDKEHTVEKIKKVTSGSTPEIGRRVDDLYRSVITAGTHLAPSIKVAEAAKVIENSQRDINIAFVNELSRMFNLMGIDTLDVLQAAGTKWNFLPFRPGLVGGHCIGVDPYYLAQKAQEFGYQPEIILAGRRMNDTMGDYVANQVIKCMIKRGLAIKGTNVLVLGITFKENCPDVRNTKVVDVVKALKDYDVNVQVYDSWADPDEVRHEYGLDLLSTLDENTLAANGKKFNAVVLAVAHKEFSSLDTRKLVGENGVVYDIKGILPTDMIDDRL